MASQTITNTKMTHKDGKPRKKLVRELREMMEEAPDESTKREIQRLADKMESM